MLSRTLVTQSTTAIACYATMPVVCNPDPRLQNRNQIAIVDRSTPLPRMPISRCHRDCTGTVTSTTPVRHRYLMLRLGPSIAMESDRLDREWQRPGFNNRGSTGPVSGEGGGVRRPVRSIIITSNFCSHVPHCMETDHGTDPVSMGSRHVCYGNRSRAGWKCGSKPPVRSLHVKLAYANFRLVI
jgi:hypothetical protein